MRTKGRQSPFGCKRRGKREGMRGFWGDENEGEMKEGRERKKCLWEGKTR